MSLKPPVDPNTPITLINVPNVQDHGARVDGTTDDTAAVLAALAVNGSAYVPAGTCIVSDLAFTSSHHRLHGAGKGATVLKAKAGASYVVRLVGLQRKVLSGMTIDGNAKASHGVLIKGSASLASQSITLDQVVVRNCNRGVDVDAGTINQADKNLYVGCTIHDCTIGLRVASANAQEQVLVNTDFVTCTDANIDISAGTLDMIGGQIQVDTGSNVGLRFSGANVSWVTLKGVIIEGPTQVIMQSASTYWPARPLTLEQCVLNGTTRNIDCATNSAGLVMRGCLINTGEIRFTGTDQFFWDEFNTYATGAVLTTSGATQHRRMKWDAGGLTTTGAAFDLKSVHASIPALIAQKTNSGQTGRIVRVSNESGTAMSGFGHLGQLALDEQTVAASPAADECWVYARDNGAGKTSLVVKFSDGTVTVLATQP